MKLFFSIYFANENIENRDIDESNDSMPVNSGIHNDVNISVMFNCVLLVVLSRSVLPRVVLLQLVLRVMVSVIVDIITELPNLKEEMQQNQFLPARRYNWVKNDFCHVITM